MTTAATTSTDRITALADAGNYREAIRRIEAELLPALSERPDDPSLARDALTAAEVYRDIARFADAERLYLHALAVDGTHGPNRPRALAGLAGVYLRLERFDRATDLFASARTAFATATDPVGLIRCLTGQADLMEALGRRREAVACVREARSVATVEKVGPTVIADVLISEVRVAGRVDGTAASVARAREAVQLRLRHSGEGHFETGYARFVLGGLLCTAEHYDDAEKLLEAARRTFTDTVGEGHPTFAAVLEAQAGVRGAKGDVRAAEQLSRRALGITRAALGDRHTWATDGHRTVGLVLTAANRFADAEECFTTALDIYRERLGEKHPVTVALRLEVAQLRETAGARREAADLTRGVLADLQAWPDDTRYEQGYARLNLLRWLGESGDASEAEAEAERLAAAAAELGNDPLLAVPALLTLADYAAQRADEKAARARLEEAERLLGPLAPNSGSRLQADGIAVSLDWTRGDAQRAVGRAREAVRRCEGTVGLAAALCFLAEQAHQSGNLAEAEEAYERALAEQQRADHDNPEQAATLRGLARVHLSRGNPAAAEVRFRRALGLRREAFGDSHPNTAESVCDMAGLAEQAGDMRAAEGMFAEVLSVRREFLGVTHPDTVAAAHSLAMVRYARGETTSAITSLEEALAPLPERHPDRSPLRHSLARVHLARGEVRRALELLAEVLADYERLVDTNHPELIPVLLDTARGHAAWWDYLEARRLLVRVRQAVASSPFPRPLDEASALLALSDSHLNLSDPEPGMALAETALQLARVSLPADDPSVIDYLLRAGEAVGRGGGFERADALLGEAEQLILQLGGERHPLRVKVWLEQAAVAVSRKRPTRATNLYEKAAALAASALGEDHADHAAVRRLTGLHLKSIGEYRTAEGHLRSYLTIIRRSLGDDHPEVAAAHNALAELLRQAGDFTAAENECRKALAVLRRTDMPADALNAAALHMLGLTLRQQGRLPEAAERFEQALTVDRSTEAGEEQFCSLESHMQLALIEAATGFHAGALARVRRITAAQEDLARANACLPPGPRRDALLSVPRRLVDLGLTLLAGGNHPAGTIADAAVRWNAIRPADIAYGDRSSLRRQLPSAPDAIDRLFDLNMQIAGRQFRGAGLEGMTVHHELLANWTAERDRLDDDLSGRLPPLARLRAWREVTVDAIRGKLPNCTALVELVRYTPIDLEKLLRGEDTFAPDRYAAVVVTALSTAVVDAGSVIAAERSDGPNAVRKAVEPHLGDSTQLIVGHGGLPRRVWGGLATSVREVRVGRELVSPLLVTRKGFVDRIRDWLGW